MLVALGVSVGMGGLVGSVWPHDDIDIANSTVEIIERKIRGAFWDR